MEKREQLERAIAELRKLITARPEYTGKVQFNFFKGGVSNINVEYSVKITKQ